MNLRSRETEVAPVALDPSPAEVARSIVASTSSLRIGPFRWTVEVARHVVEEDGSILYVPVAHSAHGQLERPGVQRVQAIATDLTPVAVPDRARGSVRLTGTSSPVAERLPDDVLDQLIAGGTDPGVIQRLVPRWIAVHRRRLGSNEAPVEVHPSAYRSAEPDPLILHEADWLNHLDRDHRDVFTALAGHLDADAAGHPARPIALQRHGFVLRMGARPRDHYVPFAFPVACGCELGDAFAELLDRTLPGGPGLRCSD